MKYKTAYWKIPKPLIGTDPEFFVVDCKTGKVVPGSIYLVNSKIHKADNREEKIGFDNAAVEIQTRPSHCLQTLNQSHEDLIRTAFKAIQLQHPKVVMCKFDSIAEIAEEDMDRPEIMEFGCDPVNICENGSVKINAIAPDSRLPFRSAGYHIHLGLSGAYDLSDNPDPRIHEMIENPLEKIKIVQMADLLLGIPSVLIYPSKKELARRKMMRYGLAGEFRDKEYGLEYRTLGGWVMKSPPLVWWANCGLRDAYKFVYLNVDLPSQFDMKEVSETINNMDIHKAIKIWNELKAFLCEEYIPNTPTPTKHCGSTIYHAKKGLSSIDFLISQKQSIQSLRSWCFGSVSGTERNRIAFYRGLFNELGRWIPGLKNFSWDYKKDFATPKFDQKSSLLDN